MVRELSKPRQSAVNIVLKESWSHTDSEQISK